MAILLARGLAVAEHHARCHGVGALQVRVVETLYVARLAVEMQFALHGVHQAFGMPLGILYFEVLHLFGAVDTRAFERELQQIGLFAAFGDGEVHLVEQQRGRGQEWHDHLAREVVRYVFDDVLYGQCEHFGLRGADTRGELNGVECDDGAVAQAYEVAVGRVVVFEQREDVAVDYLGAHDHRAAAIVLQSVETLLETLRQLEFQLLGGPHILLQIAAHGTQIAFQDIFHHLHQFGVLLLALRADARALAVAQVVLQAYAVTAARYGLRREVELARAQRNHLADELQYGVLHRQRPVRTEILRAVVPHDAGRLHAREVFAAEHDPRISFVVLQEDVVSRLVGLDERVFEQKRILLAVDHYVAYLGYLSDEHPHLGRVVLVADEVGRHALAQRLRLADVYYVARAVEELIDARGERQRRHLLFQYRLPIVHVANVVI